MDKSSRQGRSTSKNEKETAALKDTTDKIHLIDIFRAFYPKAAEYTFFSSAHEIFSKTDHRLGHKMSLNKYKKTKTTLSISSDHNGMKVEIEYKKKN